MRNFGISIKDQSEKELYKWEWKQSITSRDMLREPGMANKISKLAVLNALLKYMDVHTVPWRVSIQA